MTARICRGVQRFGIDGFEYKSYLTRFWDIFGETGHPVRVTVSSMGPVLLARLLNLTEVQAGVLNIVFRVADDNGLLLLDLKDLRAMLQYVGDNRAEFTTEYGNVSAASIGAIQRALLSFEDEGGSRFSASRSLEIKDWMRTDTDGRGYINILSAQRLIQSPTVYGTFLLWMLTELFERLPEVGDLDKPRMIFFFDEAHLLFIDAPKALLQKIVQVVKLIRSKGVGVYFVSQSPTDIPDDVLAQLSNRVQHALRAYTPAEQKSVRAAAKAFRVNPAFDTEEAIMQLGVGEALVSFLDGDGIPTVVERAYILPPQSLIGPAESDRVKSLILSDEFDLKYRESIDRESAYEIINKAAEEMQKQRLAAEEQAEAEKQRQKEEAAARKPADREAATAGKTATQGRGRCAEGCRKKSFPPEIRWCSGQATTAPRPLLAGSFEHQYHQCSPPVGKTVSSKTIASRAARNALSSVMRSGSTSISSRTLSETLNNPEIVISKRGKNIKLFPAFLLLCSSKGLAHAIPSGVKLNIPP